MKAKITNIEVFKNLKEMYTFEAIAVPAGMRRVVFEEVVVPEVIMEEGFIYVENDSYRKDDDGYVTIVENETEESFFARRDAIFHNELTKCIVKDDEGCFYISGIYWDDEGGEVRYIPLNKEEGGHFYVVFGDERYASSKEEAMKQVERITSLGTKVHYVCKETKITEIDCIELI